jgi:hypothetical protein
MKFLNSTKNVGYLTIAGFAITIIAICYFGNQLSKLEYENKDGKIKPVSTVSN